MKPPRRTCDNVWRERYLASDDAQQWWRRCSLKKDRETKEDGRYIIFFTFEDEGREDKGEGTGEDPGS